MSASTLSLTSSAVSELLERELGLDAADGMFGEEHGFSATWCGDHTDVTAAAEHMDAIEAALRESGLYRVQRLTGETVTEGPGRYGRVPRTVTPYDIVRLS